MDKKRVYVYFIGRNVGQAKKFAAEFLGITPFYAVFVQNVEQIRGLRGITIFALEGFRQHKVYSEEFLVRCRAADITIFEVTRLV